jgi:hypothetical protein
MGQAIQVGKVISLSHPKPSKWRILEVLREHDDQKYETAKDPSYASVELSCIEVRGSNRRSMMRITMQVPSLGTEEKDSATRAKQATEFRTAEFRAFLTFAEKKSTCTPPLLGYLEDQQDSFGPVPGGFITYYAWEAMPGIRLGDYTGKAPQFWTLDKKEREEIGYYHPSTSSNHPMGHGPIQIGLAILLSGNTNSYWLSYGLEK